MEKTRKNKNKKRYKVREAFTLYNKLVKPEYRISILQYDEFKNHLRTRHAESGMRCFEVRAYESKDGTTHVIDF